MYTAEVTLRLSSGPAPSGGSVVSCGQSAHLPSRSATADPVGEHIPPWSKDAALWTVRFRQRSGLCALSGHRALGQGAQDALPLAYDLVLSGPPSGGQRIQVESGVILSRSPWSVGYRLRSVPRVSISGLPS